MRPTLDASSVLDRTIQAKQDPELRDRLLTLAPRMLQRYEEFEQDPKLALAAMTPEAFADQERTDLLHCYTYRTTPVNELLRHLHTQQPRRIRRRCHYCGLDAPQRTDHYLPKEEFPEFAIHPLNLLPACTVCNEKKGAAFRTRDGTARVVLHLYFDTVPGHALFRATVRYVEGDPIAEFELLDGGLSADQLGALRRHIRRLGLLERFAEAANALIDEMASWVCEYAVRGTTAEAAAELRREARRRTQTYGPNLWEGALLLALADDETFLGNCIAMAENAS